MRGRDRPGPAQRPCSPPPRRALTCTPGAHGSKRPGSRSPPDRPLRRRARNPGPARRLRAAAGSPPRCRRQGSSAPAPEGRPSLCPFSAQRPRPGPPRRVQSRGGGCGRGLQPLPLDRQAGIWGIQPGAFLPVPRPSLNGALFCKTERRAPRPSASNFLFQVFLLSVLGPLLLSEAPLLIKSPPRTDSLSLSPIHYTLSPSPLSPHRSAFMHPRPL